jgi:hypothetical protein
MNRKRVAKQKVSATMVVDEGVSQIYKPPPEVERLALHEGQSQIVRGARRFNVVACGRRFGKTLLGIDRAIETALSGYPVAWFSPTYKMLSDAWRELKNIAASLKPKINEQEHRLALSGPVETHWGEAASIDMWSLDAPDTARGRKYKRAIIDEAAMVANLGEAWQAVIRPMLTDLLGDAWFLSTPKGHNFFWELYCKGEDPLQQEWGAWRMPTSTNPFIAPGEIEDARLMLPEMVFAQEYLADFIENAGAVFRRLRESATSTPQREAIDYHRYVMGVDLGRRMDFTVCAVIDCSGTGDQRLVFPSPLAADPRTPTTDHRSTPATDHWPPSTAAEMCAMDRFNQIDWSIQVGRITALARRFRVDEVIADATGLGDPVVEQLRRELAGDGVAVTGYDISSVQKKAKLIEPLALAFERGELVILDDPVLIGELQAYQQERLPGGQVKYGAPAGLHDDAVMALALGWHRAQYRPRALDLPERMELKRKLDRYLTPEAVRSPMGEMTRQYIGNTMLRRGWSGDDEDLDVDVDVEKRGPQELE